MKRNSTIVLATVVIAALGGAGAATVSLADGWGRHDGGRHPMGGFAGGHHETGGFGGLHMMAFFDADNDGKLTQEEIDTVRAGQLMKFDADGDGALTLSEYEALWLDAMRERMVDRFQGHDADGDGRVTGEEFGRHFANMVASMDSNGDGVLDAQDMQRHHRGDDDGNDN